MVGRSRTDVYVKLSKSQRHSIGAALDTAAIVLRMAGCRLLRMSTCTMSGTKSPVKNQFEETQTPIPSLGPGLSIFSRKCCFRPAY